MPRITKEKLHLIDKRAEIVYALDHQGYNGEEIGVIFNLHRSVISRVLKNKPKAYKPKWEKVAKNI